MIGYSIRRIFLALFILAWAAFVCFAVIAILPGDMYTRLKISIAMAGLPVEETHRAMLEEHGLDQPWIVQFAKWLWNLISKGTFGGQSLSLRVLLRPEGEIMNSFLICGTSMIAAWMMAIPLGILSTMRRGKWIYNGVILLGMPMLAMPGYYFAGLLMWFLDHFVDPMMSRAQLWGIYGWQYEGLPMSWGKFLSSLAHLAPIWFIIGMPVFVVAFRVLRSSLKDTLELPFITVARSKGLASSRVYFKHAVRYSLNPLISTIGVTLPTVLVNALLVGFVFGIPTYGDLLKNAVEYQQPALLATVMVFYSFVLVVGSLATDLGLAMVDPRIRYK